MGVNGNKLWLYLKKLEFGRETPRSSTAGITASTTHTQGQGKLVANLNEISVCNNIDDTITMPSATPGREVRIANNGAKKALLFPDKSDDLGKGKNKPVALGARSTVTYWTYDDTHWVKA